MLKYAHTETHTYIRIYSCKTKHEKDAKLTKHETYYVYIQVKLNTKKPQNLLNTKLTTYIFR